MNQLPPSLTRWYAYAQFVLVKVVPRENGKTDKIPVDVSGIPTSAHDENNWMDAATALATAEAFGLEIGFVFTEGDPFFFIDLDHCIEDGKYTEPANTIIGMFPGAALELSQSGTGVHIFGTILGTAPPHSKKDDALGIEYYTEGRFALLTGNEQPGTSVETEFFDDVLVPFVNTYFPPSEADITDWRWSPVDEWTGPEDDEILLASMRRIKKFGDKASPSDLLDNNEPILALNYPSETDTYNRSGADAALASHLAWWTGKNHDRMWKLMCQSSLLRDKWNRKDYLQRTISNAVNQCQNVYGQTDISNGSTETHLTDDPLAWAKDYEISEAEAKQISDPEWIYPNLVIRGHLSVFPAKPNAGKTTIFFHLAGEMVSRGYDVFYVNADISGADAKYLYYKASEMRIRLLLPDMKVGKSMGDIVDRLSELNETNGSLENVVFIFDTLKKMTDVISKQHSKELYKLLRALTAKGATIILLAHTNKYEDEEGNPIFEGTGDLRADVDELIYLVPMKNADGSLTVSTKPDKVRGEFKPITFDISPKRTVTLRDQYVDTQSSDQLARQIKTDQELIELINGAIDDACSNQKSIVDLVKSSSSYGVRPIRRVLSSYSKRLNNDYDIVTKVGSGSFWGIEQGDRNEHIYKKLIIVPEGGDERSYIAPIAFGGSVDGLPVRELSH